MANQQQQGNNNQATQTRDRLPFLNGQDLKENGNVIEILRVRQVKSSKMEGYFVDVKNDDGAEYTISMYNGSILEHQFMQQLAGIQFTIFPFPNKDNTRTYITTRKPENKSNSGVQQGRSSNGNNGGYRRK